MAAGMNDDESRDDETADARLEESISGFLAEIGPTGARDLLREFEWLADDLRDPALPEVGDRIDRYRILRKIAEGGMGAVFEAEQCEPVARTVALKLIRRGGASARAIERFRIEQQTLARLEHENIARLYDAGFDDRRRPYFVMELVRGVAITDFADEHSLPLEARIELFLTVCRAVRFAHQKGVLHRDLKPANILVADRDGKHVPYVIDFGLSFARLSGNERDRSDEEAEAVGTPEFMSPEQWFEPESGLDIRIDVYALGIVLYRLLTGHLPWPDEHFSKPLPEQLAERRTTPPIAPSERVRRSANRHHIEGRFGITPERLVSKLTGDLDAILARALEGRRARRYSDVAEFIADLERHRDHWPVLATEPSTRTTLVKFVRRNLAASIGGSLAVASLLAGLAATTSQWRRAEDSLVLALDRESQTQRVREYLESILSSPSDQEYSDSDPSLSDIVITEEPDVGAAFAGLPFSEAQVRLVFGRVLQRAGRLEPALEQYELALSRRADAMSSLPSEEIEAATKLRHDCDEGRLRVLLELGRNDEVIASGQECLREDPSPSLGDRARILRNVARAHEAAGRRAQALDLLDSEMVRSTPDPLVWSMLAEDYCRMLLRDGQPERARIVAKEMLARAVDKTPRRNSALATVSGLAALRCGDFEEAASRLEPAAAAVSRVFPDHHPRTRELLEALLELYRLRGAEGDLSRADELERRLAVSAPRAR